MFCKFLPKLTVLVLLILFFVLTTGCTSGADSCEDTLSEVSSLENAANGRLKTMDFSGFDDYVSAQIVASINQYSDAMALLTSSGGKDCISDVKYKNMVRSLELKIAFLDMYKRFGETEVTISGLLGKSYPDFQKDLKVTMVDLENFRYEVKSLQVMADEIDTSQLDPSNKDIIPVIKSDLGIVGSKVNQYISLLVPYQ